MSYSSRSYVNRYIPSNRFPVGLKWLLIVNIGLFVIGYLLQGAGIDFFTRILALIPAEIIGPPFAIWQFGTHLFIHGTSIGLILWNMLALWMFGAEIERLWGTQRFLRFYIVSGAVAGFAAFLCALAFHASLYPIMGSSASVNALLVAYGLMFPDQTILFGFLIPMKSKYFVMIIGGIVILQSWMAVTSGHGAGYVVAAQLLTGLLMGFLLVRGKNLRFNVRQPIASAYRDWKLQRAKRKFEVYLKKQDSNRNRRVQ
jgi:membrane associated rhomboid family serine protease